MLVDSGSPKADRRASGNTDVDIGCCCQKTTLCSFLLVFWSRQCSVEQILVGRINTGGQGQIGCDAKRILKWHHGTLFFRQPRMTHLLVQHRSSCVTTVNLRWWLSGSCIINQFCNRNLMSQLGWCESWDLSRSSVALSSQQRWGTM